MGLGWFYWRGSSFDAGVGVGVFIMGSLDLFKLVESILRVI
jgi:hypothetical protein